MRTSHAAVAEQRHCAYAQLDPRARSSTSLLPLETISNFRADRKAVDVAELFGVRPETVWRWEHGETEIPRTAAYALGQLYKHPKLTRQSLEALAAS
jgi:transcriptional regulator with XRE-family HTH domain